MAASSLPSVFTRTSLALAIATVSAHAGAATFRVTNTNANGPGSFDQAIRDANDAVGADTIEFDVTGTIDLQNQYLETISGGLTIVGPGSGKLNIYAGDSPSEASLMRNSGVLSVSGLRLSGTSFGALAVFGEGTLNIDDVKVIGLAEAYSPIVYGGSATTTVNVSNSEFRDISLLGHPVVSVIQNCTLTIQNTIISGNTSNASPAVRVDGSTATIEDSVISNNTNTGTVTGGAITSILSQVTIDNTVLSGNSAPNASFLEGGGAFFSNGASTLTVTNSVFSNNSAGTGGAMLFRGNEGSAMNATISRSSFINNRADGFAESSSGGVIELGADAVLSLNDVVMRGNHADERGGALSGSGATVTATNVVFDDNTSDVSGGAISVAGPLTLTGVTMTDNSAAVDGGALLHFGVGSETVLVENSVISRNQAGDDGGGLFIEGSATTVVNTLVSGNTAGDIGGGLYVSAQASGGGTSLEGATVSGNTAAHDGALHARLSEGRTFGLSNTTVSGNTATAGAAMTVQTRSSGGFVMSKSTVSGNVAGGSASAVRITHSDASYNSNSYAVINESTFSGNRAGNAAAAITFGAIEDVAISHSTFVDNQGSGSGSTQIHQTASPYYGIMNVTTGAPFINISDSILSSSNTRELFVGGDSLAADGTPSTDVFSLEPEVTLIDSIAEQGYAKTTNATENTILFLEEDPLLGPLANNGGATKTHAPLSSFSPGVDTGEGAFATGSDQRGVTTQGAGPDRGAVEYTSNTAPTLNINLLSRLAGAPGKVISDIVVADAFVDAESNNISTVSVTGLPSGLTWTPGTDTISGSLTQEGEYFVTVTVTDDGAPAMTSTVQGAVVVKKANKKVFIDTGSSGGAAGGLMLSLLALLGLRRRR